MSGPALRSALEGLLYEATNHNLKAFSIAAHAAVENACAALDAEERGGESRRVVDLERVVRLLVTDLEALDQVLCRINEGEDVDVSDPQILPSEGKAVDRAKHLLAAPSVSDDGEGVLLHRVKTAIFSGSLRAHDDFGRRVADEVRGRTGGSLPSAAAPPAPASEEPTLPEPDPDSPWIYHDREGKPTKTQPPPASEGEPGDGEEWVLLPCPFCGRHPEDTDSMEHLDDADDDDDDETVQGLCPHCGACGPEGATLAEALDAWNRRPAPPAKRKSAGTEEGDDV